MIYTENAVLRERTIFWAAVMVTAASALLLAERWFFGEETWSEAAGSALFIGFCWIVYGVYKSFSRYSAYSLYLYPPALLGIFLLLMFINPFSGESIWVYMLLFPPALALGVTPRLYIGWTAVFVLFYTGYILNNNAVQAAASEGSFFTYFILLGLSIFIGNLIVRRLHTARDQFRRDVMYEKNTYLLQLFRTLIPTVEVRTQIQKSEIDEMSMLMSRTEKYMDEPLLEKWEIELLSMAHYVSRIQLPDYLYEKTGRLSRYEQNTVQEHCRFAADLIPEDAEMERIKRTLEQHHERKDGSGYPHGLVDGEISLSAQLLGLTESYLSLTQDRIYRGAYPPEDAAAKLKEEAENLFDKKLVGAFLQCLQEENYIASSTEYPQSSRQKPF